MNRCQIICQPSKVKPTAAMAKTPVPKVMLPNTKVRTAAERLMTVMLSEVTGLLANEVATATNIL